MLTDEQLNGAWSGPFTATAANSGWVAWENSYAQTIDRFAGMSNEEFRTEAAQKTLWSAEEAGSIGQGEHIHVAGAWKDSDTIDRFLRLRDGPHPEVTEERAAAIQVLADEILAGVHPKYTKTRHKPLSKLHRALAVLRPDDIHCAYSWPSNDHVTDLLVGKRKGLGVIAARVLAVARLREVLGPTENTAAKVRCSIFCWWLHENYDELSKTGSVSKAEPKPALPRPSQMLDIWAFAKQLKGIFPIKGLADCFREVVRVTVEGPQRDDLMAALRSDPEYDSLSLNSWRLVVLRVQTLGLVELRGDRFFPTPSGEELLDTGDFDILLEKLLQSVYGFAQTLRLLSGTGGLTQEGLFKNLRQGYPRWTTDRVPAALLAWCRNLGVITRDAEKRFVLTEDGVAWHSRLPERLPGPADVVQGAEAEDEEAVETGGAAPQVSLTIAPLASLEKELSKAEESSGFQFDPLEVRALHLAWHALDHKRFVLLTGLSGTGKTQLLRLYARAYCRTLDLDSTVHVTVIAVAPDWRDPTSLLGYFNALHEDPTFYREPATTVLLHAYRDPGRPYFLILDEMNLARPEHYFAPFLASMESGEPIRLHGEDREVNGVPPSIPWPRNLFVGGTVNIDETTHAFSDKVLDRAFTLEFWDANLPGFFERRLPRDERTEDLLIKLYEALRPIRRHFGYRTAEEVLRFVNAARNAGIDAAGVSASLDQAVAAKVLPHLRGDSADGTATTLDTLSKILPEQEFPRCYRKVSAMRDQLQRAGIMGFF
jgi:5-methylcytosine-specific restriction protein B